MLDMLGRMLFFAKYFRCYAVDLFEYFVEIGYGAETHIITDGRYGISIDVPGDESTFKWSDKDGKLQINDSGSDIRFTLQLFSWETRGEGDIIIYVPEGI